MNNQEIFAIGVTTEAVMTDTGQQGSKPANIYYSQPGNYIAGQQVEKPSYYPPPQAVYTPPETTYNPSETVFHSPYYPDAIPSMHYLNQNSHHSGPFDPSSVVAYPTANYFDDNFDDSQNHITFFSAGHENNQMFPLSPVVGADHPFHQLAETANNPILIGASFPNSANNLAQSPLNQIPPARVINDLFVDETLQNPIEQASTQGSLKSAKKQPKKRKRATTACDICSKLRQKCSGDKPCSSCVLKSQECTYTRKTSRRGPPKLEKLLSIKNMLEEQLIMRSSVLNQPTPLPSFTLAESSSTTTPFKEEPSSSSLDAGELKRKQAHILYNQKHESGHLIEVDLVKSLSLDDFKSLLVWDQSQSWLSFYDFYFKHLYPTFPYISQTWITAHLSQVPLFYLHSMYAMSLLISCKVGRHQRNLITAHHHYKYSQKLLHQDLDQGNIFSVACMIHLANFALASPIVTDTESVTYFTLASKLSQVLLRPGVVDDKVLDLEVQRFHMAVWFQLHFLDIRLSHVFTAPFLFEDEIDVKSFRLFSTLVPATDEQFTLFEHDLSRLEYMLPLINICSLVLKEKRMDRLEQVTNKHLTIERAMELKIMLDEWFNTLPPALQIWPNETKWKGLFVMELNCIYHITTIMLFLHVIDLQYDPHLVPIPPSACCLISANVICSMARLLNQQYMNQASLITLQNAPIPLSTLMFLQFSIYIAAFSLCAFSLPSEIHKVGMNVECHLLDALTICGASRAYDADYVRQSSSSFDTDLVRSCIGNANHALRVLKSRLVS